MKHLLLVTTLLLAGCSAGNIPAQLQSPAKIQDNPMVEELNELKPLNGPVMTIAVYIFTDKTG